MLPLLLVWAMAGAGCRSQAPMAAERYLLALDEQVADVDPLRWTASAESAAEHVVAGGQIWAGGPQAAFAVEAFNRAGGLTAVRMLEAHEPEAGDVVLFAMVDQVVPADADRIDRWRRAGVQVVVFARDPARPAGWPVRDGQMVRLCPIDSLINVVRLWVWTGEFVSACTRRGRMPVLYQSYGVEGGRARGEKYAGRGYHDDVAIAPIGAGVLGQRYVDAVRGYLRQVRETELDQLRRIADVWRRARPSQSVALTLGHLYPGHFLDERAPRPIRFDHKGPLRGAAVFVLHVGYQDPPEDLIAEAATAQIDVAYISVGPAEPAEPAPGIIYVDPHWPRSDACVSVEGYDIPILPASGVINAALFWATLAQSLDPGA